MKNPENETTTFFLEFLLTAYFNNNIIFSENLLNLSLITPAVNSFLMHYKDEDELHKTNHLEIIKKIFITREIKSKNCNEAGLSSKTFYRYKNMYLITFKHYLIQEFTELS